jgi:hypothetical protein
MKTIVTAEEMEKVESESSAARYFMTNSRFQFIRDYLQTASNDISEKIINNRVTEVREELTITDKLKRIFITNKKVQIDELIGAYKWINQFMSDMQTFVDLPDRYREAESKKKIIIRTSDERS